MGPKTVVFDSPVEVQPSVGVATAIVASMGYRDGGGAEASCSGALNSVNIRSRKRESGTSYFLFGIVLLCATLAFVIFGRLDAPWQAFAALGAGAALGIWLFRFGSRHAWVSLLCLFAALGVCVVLFLTADTVGSAGIAWIGAFVAGTNLGAAWRLFTKTSKARAVR